MAPALRILNRTASARVIAPMIEGPISGGAVTFAEAAVRSVADNESLPPIRLFPIDNRLLQRVAYRRTAPVKPDSNGSATNPKGGRNFLT